MDAEQRLLKYYIDLMPPLRALNTGAISSFREINRALNSEGSTTGSTSSEENNDDAECADSPQSQAFFVQYVAPLIRIEQWRPPAASEITPLIVTDALDCYSREFGALLFCDAGAPSSNTLPEGITLAALAAKYNCSLQDLFLKKQSFFSLPEPFRLFIHEQCRQTYHDTDDRIALPYEFSPLALFPKGSQTISSYQIQVHYTVNVPDECEVVVKFRLNDFAEEYKEIMQGEGQKVPLQWQQDSHFTLKITGTGTLSVKNAFLEIRSPLDLASLDESFFESYIQKRLRGVPCFPHESACLAALVDERLSEQQRIFVKGHFLWGKAVSLSFPVPHESPETIFSDWFLWLAIRRKFFVKQLSSEQLTKMLSCLLLREPHDLFQQGRNILRRELLLGVLTYKPQCLKALRTSSPSVFEALQCECATLSDTESLTLQLKHARWLLAPLSSHYQRESYPQTVAHCYAALALAKQDQTTIRRLLGCPAQRWWQRVVDFFMGASARKHSKYLSGKDCLRLLSALGPSETWIPVFLRTLGKQHKRFFNALKVSSDCLSKAQRGILAKTIPSILQTLSDRAPLKQVLTAAQQDLPFNLEGELLPSSCLTSSATEFSMSNVEVGDGGEPRSDCSSPVSLIVLTPTGDGVPFHEQVIIPIGDRVGSDEPNRGYTS